MKEEFKVGQRWRRRDGNIVTIFQHDESDAEWPWMTNEGEWYNSAGNFNRHETHEYDLVELVSDELPLDELPPQDDFGHALSCDSHPYHLLANALVAAFNQAASGKGKERHANDGVRFEDQPMSTINKALGSIDGFVYQAHKKSLEAKRLPNGRSQAELYGAINYLAGAIIALDTWANK